MSALEILVRLSLTLASVCINIPGNVNRWASGAISLFAIGVTIELAIRPYANYLVRRALLGSGALVTIFITAGLLLNVTPWGLTRVSWNFAWLIFSVCVLWRRRKLRSDWKRPIIRVNFFGVSIVLTAFILVGALILALAGVRNSDEQSRLSFSTVTVDAHSVVVEINATSVSGNYEILAATATGVQRYSSGPFRIQAGSKGMVMKKSIPVKFAGRLVVSLEATANKYVLRQLIVVVK